MKRSLPLFRNWIWNLAAIEKGGYDHFMLKEIFEQPQTIFDCLRGRLDKMQERLPWLAFRIILSN